MRLFVCEAICGGCSAGLVDSSLRAEGTAMLSAVVKDFRRLPNCHVTTLWDRRLGVCPGDDAEVVTVSNPEEAIQTFRQLAGECDATFDIAPELDGLMLQRRQIVDEVGGSCLGPTADAIALCADKLRLAEHASTWGLPTINTRLLFDEDFVPEQSIPFVIKRRDGAGALGMHLVQHPAEWDSLRPEASADATDDQMIVQPFVKGRHLSAAAIIGQDGASVEIFPLGEQLLSDEGTFRYLGGRIPVEPGLQQSAADLVRSTVATIPGLAGYVGFDILLPDDEAEELLLVEINPRLTTSYLGYRALARENIAERLLFSDPCRGPIQWKSGKVEFSPTGVICRPNDMRRTQSE